MSGPAQLYTREGEEGPSEWIDDSYRVLDFITSITSVYGIQDPTSLDRVFVTICNAGRVLRGHVGISSPSVFKQAAAFSVGFMMESPIDQTFGAEHVGQRIGNISNHQNAIIAFEWARWSLEGATVIKTVTNSDGEKEESEVILEKKIEVSKHFYADAVLALSSIRVNRTPLAEVPPGSAVHFHFLALLYESLAYAVNPQAAYREKI